MSIRGRETAQQRLIREEQERQARVAKQSDSTIAAEEDAAAARRAKLLNERQDRAKALAGHGSHVVSPAAAPAGPTSPTRGIPAAETVQQRLQREEKERQARLAAQSDSSIQAREDAAAARRQAYLQGRVAEAKKLEGTRHAAAGQAQSPPAVATRGIDLNGGARENIQSRLQREENERLARVGKLSDTSIAAKEDAAAARRAAYLQGRVAEAKKLEGARHATAAQAGAAAVATRGLDAAALGGGGETAQQRLIREEQERQARQAGQSDASIAAKEDAAAARRQAYLQGRVAEAKKLEGSPHKPTAQSPSRPLLHSQMPPAGETAQQRLVREEKERQARLAKLSDASIQGEEDAAAARRQAYLQGRVAEAKKLEGTRHAAAGQAQAQSPSPPAVATRGITDVGLGLAAGENAQTRLAREENERQARVAKMSDATIAAEEEAAAARRKAALEARVAQAKRLERPSGASPPRHIPGYTGHVSGKNQKFGKSFGTITGAPGAPAAAQA